MLRGLRGGTQSSYLRKKAFTSTVRKCRAVKGEAKDSQGRGRGEVIRKKRRGLKEEQHKTSIGQGILSSSILW